MTTCKIVSLLISTCVSWTLAIVEAIILSESTSARYGCGNQIWGAVLACCIVHVIGGIVNFTLTMLLLTNYEKHKNTQGTSLLLAVLGLTVAVWALVAYYSADSACAEFYRVNYVDLWKMLFVECVLFYVVCGLVFLMVCCGGVAALREEKNYNN
jgi:hypothetical protein